MNWGAECRSDWMWADWMAASWVAWSAGQSEKLVPMLADCWADRTVDK